MISISYWRNVLNILENEQGIFDAILAGNFDLEGKPWPSISNSAKDLIRKMLTYEPKKRITAAEALGKYAIAIKLSSDPYYKYFHTLVREILIVKTYSKRNSKILLIIS